MITEWAAILCSYYDHETHAKAFYAILVSAYEYLTFQYILQDLQENNIFLI